MSRKGYEDGNKGGRQGLQKITLSVPSTVGPQREGWEWEIRAPQRGWCVFLVGGSRGHAARCGAAVVEQQGWKSPRSAEE